MNNAKRVWLLSNGETVSIGDKIQVDNGIEVYIAQVIGIGETYIAKKKSTGEKSDSYFNDLKDIRVLK